MRGGEGGWPAGGLPGVAHGGEPGRSAPDAPGGAAAPDARAGRRAGTPPPMPGGKGWGCQGGERAPWGCQAPPSAKAEHRAAKRRMALEAGRGCAKQARSARGPRSTVNRRVSGARLQLDLPRPKPVDVAAFMRHAVGES